MMRALGFRRVGVRGLRTLRSSAWSSKGGFPPSSPHSPMLVLYMRYLHGGCGGNGRVTQGSAEASSSGTAEALARAALARANAAGQGIKEAASQAELRSTFMQVSPLSAKALARVTDVGVPLRHVRTHLDVCHPAPATPRLLRIAPAESLRRRSVWSLSARACSTRTGTRQRSV